MVALPYTKRIYRVIFIKRLSKYIYIYIHIYIYSSNIPSIIYLYYFFLTIKDDLDITKLNNNKFEGTGYLIKSMKFQLQCWNLGHLEGVWFVFLNNSFQFLNNISRILMYLFTHTYFYKYF